MSNQSTYPRLNLRKADRKLTVEWSSTASCEFHLVWLRHSGRCTHGMPNDTTTKIDLLPDDLAELNVVSAEVRSGQIRIAWSDNVQTEHDVSALRAAAYDDASRARRKHHPILWAAETEDSIPRFTFAEIDSDARLLDLLLAVADYGLVKISGVPREPGAIRTIAKRFGPIHVNNYGELFDVRSDANLGLGSNTGIFLPPHTDESYRHEVPGISFFHCLQAAASGGESILVDGFCAANVLRETYPESFDVLSSVPIFFQRYALPDEDMRSHARVLVRDIDGDVVGVRWTDRTLPPQDLPAELVEPVYCALQRLWKIVNDPSMRHVYAMCPGDLHVFDNHRVLHGRMAFDATEGGRHLQQCSVNRDEFHNRLRVLAAHLGHEAAGKVMAGGAGG